jgi:hypothetical protein
MWNYTRVSWQCIRKSENRNCVCLQVREWQLVGLPTDSVSTDNGIMAMQRRQWPLIIDPQVHPLHFVEELWSVRGFFVLDVYDRCMAWVMVWVVVWVMVWMHVNDSLLSHTSLLAPC